MIYLVTAKHEGALVPSGSTDITELLHEAVNLRNSWRESEDMADARVLASIGAIILATEEAFDFEGGREWK